MKNNLKILRAKYDLTQKELAKKVDVTRQTIISIEKERYEPSLTLAFKLASFFDIKIKNIFIYKENRK
jgi:putative transcriptional regulator